MNSLRNYEEWKYCITVLCNIPLTKDFVEKRLSELRDVRGYDAQRFVSTWGEAHRNQVIAWFEQAKADLERGVIAS